MKVYEELVARGLIAQVTNEEEIRNLVNEGKAVFYIGFDPTADSLHVGHFMALCLMKRLQMAGNRPVVLIGGGTGHVGDPSDRTDLRKMMTKILLPQALSLIVLLIHHLIKMNQITAPKTPKHSNILI